MRNGSAILWLLGWPVVTKLISPVRFTDILAMENDWLAVMILFAWVVIWLGVGALLSHMDSKAIAVDLTVYEGEYEEDKTPPLRPANEG